MTWHEARGLAREEPLTMLTIPDVRQHDDYDCGTACVDAVLRFFGVRTTAGVLGLANPVQGTSPDTVEALLRATGLPVLSGTLRVADLKYLTHSGRPVLCPVAISGGHWVVVAGVWRTTVYYHDPDEGPRAMPAGKWRDLWRDGTRAGHEFDRWGIAVG